MPKTTKSKPKGPPSPTVKLLGKCYVAKGMMPKTVSKGLRLVHNFEPPNPKRRRSEEHTSELQSPDHLVCRLLLEKKKRTRIPVAKGNRERHSLPADCPSETR